MPAPIKPQLNQFAVLRYDGGHTAGGEPPERRIVSDAADSGSQSLGWNGRNRSEPPDLRPTTDRQHEQAGSADMQVNGAGSVPGSAGVGQPRPAAEVPQTTAARPIAPRDEVEISTAGKMLDELNQSPEVRAERLTQIKAAIEAGEYETPEKLEAALEKLLQHVSVSNDQDE